MAQGLMIGNVVKWKTVRERCKWALYSGNVPILRRKNIMLVLRARPMAVYVLDSFIDFNQKRFILWA